MKLQKYLDSFKLPENTIFTKFIMRHYKQIQSESYIINSEYNYLMISSSDSEGEKVFKHCKLMFEALQQTIFKNNPIIYIPKKHYPIIKNLIELNYKESIELLKPFVLGLNDKNKFLYFNFLKNFDRLLSPETEKAFNILEVIPEISMRDKSFIMRTKEFKNLSFEFDSYLEYHTNRNFNKMSKLLPYSYKNKNSITDYNIINDYISKLPIQEQVKLRKLSFKEAKKIIIRKQLKEQISDLIVALFLKPDSVKISLNKEDYRKTIIYSRKNKKDKIETKGGKFYNYSYALINHFFNFLTSKNLTVKGMRSLNISFQSNITLKSFIPQVLKDFAKIVKTKTSYLSLNSYVKQLSIITRILLLL